MRIWRAVSILPLLALAVAPMGAATKPAAKPAAKSESTVAAKQPLTHEAMWLMKRVGSPAISPDGRRVVFSVTDPSYEEKKQTTDLWIAAVDGSEPPRRLTSAKGSESGATWSPDSTRIAFSAKRDDDEVNQIYVLDLARGGEALRLTSSPLSAGSPRWSPDGKQLAYSSIVYPNAKDDEENKKIAAERKEPKSKVRIYDSFPIRSWDRWLDDTQGHIYVINADGSGKSKDLLAGTKLVAAPGFSGRGSETAGQDFDVAWAPDGKSLVFVATTEKNVAARAAVRMQLWEVPVAGGEPRQLTTAGESSYGSPTFSPDGKSLAFSVSAENGKVYSLDRIGMAPWPWTGATSLVTATFDRSVGNFLFSPEGSTIYLTAEDQGHVRIFKVPAAGGETTLAVDPPGGVYGSIDIADKAASPVMVATWSSAVNPAEIVRVDLAAGKHTPLTTFNVEKAASLDWQPLQEFWFTAKSGRKIHSFVALPQKFDPSKKYPLFVLMHGGFANMWTDQISLRWNYHLIAPGFVVVATDYRGSTGYGEQFSLDISGDPLRGPADDINEAADEAIRRYSFIDGTRQAAAGASYGGHLANWMEATTTRYKCIISHAGLSSLETQWSTSDGIFHRELMMGGPFWEKTQAWLDQSPVTYARNFHTPMLLSVGENDFRVPMNNALEMYAVLQRQQVPARLLIWPDENHWITKGENSKVFYREVNDWLTKWVK